MKEQTMFTPVSVRAASVYRQVGVQSSVEGATPHMLIKLLFDGLMQSLNAARGSLQRGDISEKGRHLSRAIGILEEGLQGGLNMEKGGELAENLAALYDYCARRLLQASVHNDEKPIEEVVRLLGPVAQSWEQIGQNAAAGMKAGE
jgi:flagellar protein FliS